MSYRFEGKDAGRVENLPRLAFTSESRSWRSAEWANGAWAG
jgi:hypothetical protein